MTFIGKQHRNLFHLDVSQYRRKISVITSGKTVLKYTVQNLVLEKLLETPMKLNGFEFEIVLIFLGFVVCVGRLKTIKKDLLGDNFSH